MNKDVATERKLKIIGVPDDMIAQYQRYVDSGNRQGQERLLSRLRGMKNEILWKNREKLACLDYIIAKVEKTEGLTGSR